jgi:hypothetical protein
MEKNDNMLRYEKAHDDVRKIFESDKSLDERLNEFNDYLKGYVNNIDEEDNGMIRTLLVIGKSFKTNPIVKDNLDYLVTTLKTRLNVDFI